MSFPQTTSRWRDLLNSAYTIIDHVNRDAQILTDWSLGGGTAMMIRIDHRESHDVDLFLNDPQLLPYVVASASDMRFALGEPTYNGDGTGHLKVAFDGIGEIDFIVAAHITNAATNTTELEGRSIQLETIPEIVSKKIRFRGSSIQPRDIFDVAAACEAGFRKDIELALSEIPDFVATTLKTLNQLQPDYVNANIGQLMLRDKYKHLTTSAFDLTREILQQLEND